MTQSLPSPSTWASVLDRIRPQVNEQTFNTWFSQTEFVALEGDTLILQGPNQFFVDWLITHHLELIQRAAHDLIGPRTRVEVNVDPVPHPAAAAAPTQGAIPVDAHRNSNRPSSPPRSARDIGLNPRYVFDNFVVGDNSRLAHAACQAVADQPGEAYNPLFLYGGVGLGKTHLMQAIGNRVLEQDPGTVVHYVSAESFMNELIQAIRSGKNLEFKNRYRNVDLLLIDDVQFLAGKESTQQEFFHTFNALYQADKQIVVSSDRPPSEIPTLEERLRSRFEWGLLCDVQAPNLETRIAILRKKVEKEEIPIPDEVLVFIAESVKTNIRELEGALVKLLAFASLTKADVSLDTARDVLKNFARRDQPRRDISMAEVIKATSGHFGIGLDALRSKVRTRPVAHARQVGMYLCRKYTGSSFQQIGMKFGGRDHTTVVYGVDKISKNLDHDAELRQSIHEILQVLRD